MADKFHDPNNHVPEVAPGDDWGDEEVVAADAWETGSVPILPPKRLADEKSAIYREVKEDTQKGIEIGVRVVEETSEAPKNTKKRAHRLEVQELAPKPGISVPESAPVPKVVPKQVMEKMEVAEGEDPEAWTPRASEGENWGKQRKIPVRWMVITGVLLGAGLITIAVLLPKLGWKGEKSSKSYFSKLEIDDTPVLATVADSQDLPENAQEQATALGVAYANAKTVEEVLPLVKDRARVEPLIRQRWKPFPLKSKWSVPDEAQWSIQKADKRDFGHLSGVLPDFNPFQMFFVTEAGKVVIDWEASSGYSETTFADLSKNQGTGGVTRGALAPADLYTFSLPEETYQCYRVTSPDREIGIWCYVKRDSPHAEKIAALFQQSAIPREMFSEYPVTLKLEKAPADSLPNQWVIAEMLHIDWITP